MVRSEAKRRGEEDEALDSYEKAVDLFKKSAAKHHYQAECNLGGCYEHGHGVLGR